jgi:hypothetical protein
MRGLSLVHSNTCGCIEPMRVTESAASILRQAEPEMACLMVIEILQRMHFQCKHWQSGILSRPLVSLHLTRVWTHLNVRTIETLQDASLYKKMFGDPTRSFRELKC